MGIYKPPCECKWCLQHQFYSEAAQTSAARFRYGGSRSAAQVIATARSHKEKILKCIETLRQLLTLNGDTILNQWRNFTVQQRREHLQSSSTKLYPDENFRLFVHGNIPLASLRANRITLLLPYLNLESLSADWTHLIGLLHYRSNFHPEHWVIFDSEQLSLGRSEGGLEQVFAEGCITMYGNQYGELKPFSRAEVHRRDAYSVPCALLVLEAQLRLMGTLSDIASTIMRGEQKDPASFAGRLEGKNGGCSEWGKAIADGLKVRGNEPWLPVGNLRPCQPWSKPPAFDIDTIIAIARSQVDETQDQLWLLQTEPTTFLEQALLLEKIWLYNLPGVDGWSNSRKYQEIARILIYQQYANAREWKWVLEECENVKYEYGKSWDPVRVGKPLFWKYEKALGSLELLLLHCLNSGSRLDLQQDLASAPSFKDYWEVTEITEGPVHRVVVRLRNKYKLEELYEKDRLMWCLYILALEPVEQSSWDVPLVLQRLDDHLTNSPPVEVARVSSIMYGYVAEVAALNQMLSALRLHRPRFSTLRYEDVMDEERPIWRFLKENPDENVLCNRPTEWADLILPLSKFQMPMGIRDKSWLSKAELVRKEIASVWVQVREALIGSYRRHKNLAVDIEQYRSMLSHHETPEQKARWSAERQRIHRKLPIHQIPSIVGGSGSNTNHAQKVVAADAVGRTATQELGTIMRIDDRRNEVDTSVPVATPSASLEDRKLSLLSTSDTDLEGQIRGLQLDEPSGAEDSETHYWEKYPALGKKKVTGEAQEETTKPGLIVKQRHVRAVSLLFPSERGDRGTMMWTDFTSLMAELGFTIQFRGGSSYSFKAEYGSINFHRPHPGSEISPSKVRDYGWRLSARFNWRREMFKLAA